MPEEPKGDGVAGERGLQVDMSRWGAALSLLAGVGGALAIVGGIVAVAHEGLQSYLLEGPHEWWAKPVGVVLSSGSVVAFIAIAALLLDRSATRAIAVAGLLLWAATQVLIAVDQLQFIGG